MRRLLLLGLLPFACGLSAAPAPTPAPPPNFLFIAIDDLNTFNGFSVGEAGNFLQTIYPDPEVRAAVAARLTPNLDRLQRNAATFQRAYCHSALCGPSRTALLTGIPTHLSGYYQHARNFRTYPTLHDTVTLPQYLQAQGYFTAGLGKIFHKPVGNPAGTDANDWADARHSWTQWINHPTGCNGGTKSRYSPPDGLFSFGPSRLATAEAADYQLADFVARVLADGSATTTNTRGRGDGPVTLTLPADQPFFLAAGLFRPHLPFHAPREYFDRFPVDEMTGLNRAALDAIIADLDDIPRDGLRFADRGSGKMHALMERGRELEGAPGEIAAWRSMVQAYLACVSFADTCVGRIIQGYVASPRRDNTVIVLWSDHGYHLGDKYHVAKQALWEEANRCVLMIRDPRLPGSLDGQPRHQLTALTDLYPTLTDLAGLPTPDHIMGTSLRPLLQDAAAPELHSELLMTYQEGNHAIRTPTHTFARYRDGGVELYDDLTDPFQFTNLAGRPELAALQAELAARLTTLTAGAVPAPDREGRSNDAD